MFRRQAVTNQRRKALVPSCGPGGVRDDLKSLSRHIGTSGMGQAATSVVRHGRAPVGAKPGSLCNLLTERRNLSLGL
jgi:hypothetical protein